jgi:hypothetical protein
MSLLLDALKKAEQAKREKATAEAVSRPLEAGRESRAPATLDEGVELRLEPWPDEGTAGAGSRAAPVPDRDEGGEGELEEPTAP